MFKAGDLVRDNSGIKATVVRVNKNGTVRIGWINERTNAWRELTVRASDLTLRFQIAA